MSWLLGCFWPLVFFSKERVVGGSTGHWVTCLDINDYDMNYFQRFHLKIFQALAQAILVFSREQESNENFTRKERNLCLTKQPPYLGLSQIEPLLTFQRLQ